MLMKFFKPGTLANSEDSDEMPQNATFIRVFTVCLDKFLSN